RRRQAARARAAQPADGPAREARRAAAAGEGRARAGGQMIGVADIEAARARVRDAIYVSPCAHSETLSRIAGNRVYLKLENLQMTGSFKEPGALNKEMATGRREG